MTNENEKEFIKALACLSRKYGIKIGGCGCCGSPSLDAMEDKERHPEAGYMYEYQLEWASPSEFGWDDEGYMYKDKVVR